MNNPTVASKHRVLVAYDFSELAGRAVLQGQRIAVAHPGTELHVVCVGHWQGDPVLDLMRLPQQDDAISHAEATVRARDGLQRCLAQQAGAAKQRYFVHVVRGEPADQIVDLATRLDADLIVLGTHGRTGIARLALGSVAESVVRRAPCGVLVIRPRDFLEGKRLPAVEPPTGLEVDPNAGSDIADRGLV